MYKREDLFEVGSVEENNFTASLTSTHLDMMSFLIFALLFLGMDLMVIVFNLPHSIIYFNRFPVKNLSPG